MNHSSSKQSPSNGTFQRLSAVLSLFAGSYGHTDHKGYLIILLQSKLLAIMVRKEPILSLPAGNFCMLYE